MSRLTAVPHGTPSARPVRVPTRRWAVAGIALLSAASLLTGCSSGTQAHTSMERSVVDGETAQIGDMVVRYVYVDSPAPGRATTARVYAGIYNNGSRPEVLTGASSDAAGSVDLVAPATAASPAVPPVSPSPPASPDSGTAAGQLSIPPGSGLLLTPDSGGHLALRSLSRPLLAGQNVGLTLTFQNAGRVTLSVPVQVPASPAERPSPTKAGEG